MVAAELQRAAARIVHRRCGQGTRPQAWRHGSASMCWDGR
jgi:hypothetical protein